MQKIINGPVDLRERTLIFSKDVIGFSKSLERSQFSAKGQKLTHLQQECLEITLILQKIIDTLNH